jgi:hypothetical protein
MRARFHRSLVLAGLLCSAAAQTQTETQKDTQAPAIADGPLVCFTVARGDGKDRENVHFVANVDSTAAPREFFRSHDHARVLQRLDRDHLLVASFGSPYALLVVDLGAGTTREMAPGAPHEFVAVHGDDALFLGDRREPAHDNFLYATPWRDPGERRRLAEKRFQRVPLVQGNLAIALTEDNEVWVVSLVRAQGRRLWTAERGVTDLRLSLSPAGQRLAIGCVDNGRGLLTVVDTSTGEVLRTVADLPIQVSVDSSSTPVLEVGWRDDGHVVCSETRGDVQGMRGTFVFVTRDLATGEVIDETVYSDLGLRHEAPPVPGAVQRSTPRFEVRVDGEKSVLRAKGKPEPLASIDRANQQYEDLCVSRDGSAATARLGADRRRLVLFTAANATPRELANEWAHDITWLPAAK